MVVGDPRGAPAPGSGLTTTKAAFIEEARAHGDIYIHQPYQLYSPDNHGAGWGHKCRRNTASFFGNSSCAMQRSG